MIIEDTFILLDALEEDINYLKNLKPKICFEIGLVVVVKHKFVLIILKKLKNLKPRFRLRDNISSFNFR